MIWIAHRGNLNGPRKETENSPDQIDYAISQGFDVEIDVRRFGDGHWYLGHDHPDYKIDYGWLLDRTEHLWVHCKNDDAFNCLVGQRAKLNFFWHQNDRFVLTSKGVIWAYPSSITMESAVSVMPEWIFPPGNYTENCFKLPDYFKVAWGICSDYIAKYKEANT